jgi:glycosyltransferase involved in cell wall biosynthesis
MAFNGHFHLHFYPGLAKHFRRLRPDIAHIDEEPYNVATGQAMRLAKASGTKALFFTWQNIHRRYPPPFSLVESYNLRNTDYAVAGNAEAVKVLEAKGYRGLVKVIPQFGVDPEIYRVSGSKAVGPQAETLRPSRWSRGTCPALGPWAQGPGGRQVQGPRAIGSGQAHNLQPFVIGYVGRLVEEKGVHVLLRAVAALDDASAERHSAYGRTGWKLRILGSGPERSRLEGLAEELGIARLVRFEDPIPSAQMPDHYRQLDALALPSLTRPNWKEQFGRVLIEAMACGVPVVGSDSGEIPNVIGTAGLVFAEGDVPALRDSLSLLMADPALRDALARKGREGVLAHYTQVQVAAQTYQVYQELLGGLATDRQ